MILIKKKLPKPSFVLDTYWKFAVERQNIFFNRINGNQILTNDPILLKHKFTNAYRASDRVSQYLIKEVIYGSNQNLKEVLFRILLFKIFNKIETWELLTDELGPLSWEDYSFDSYSRVLFNAMNAKESIYSGAYIMASGKNAFGWNRKHENHLKLIELMMSSNLIEKVQESKSMEDVYNILLTYPTIGKFLAYQYAVDINYSTLTDFNEMDFVMPGPGASDGIKKCFITFGDYSESDIIKYVTDIQQDEFDRLELNFQNLWGRNLQLIDCQNIFCETDKYSRVAHPEINGISDRTRIKQIYRPSSKNISYWYPPKWGLNDRI